MSMTGDDFDLVAELEAHLDGEVNKTPAQQEEAPEGETAEQQEERLYRRTGSKFSRVEEEKKAEATEAKEGADLAKDGAEKKTDEVTMAPRERRPTWYKDEYGDWAKLPENFRTALREQERNAAQAIEKHSTAAKAWEPVNELLKPHMNELAAAGVSGPQYVSQLVQADKYLRADPIQALNWLAQNYLGAGWDIRALADWMDSNNVQTQKVDPVQQELAALKQKLERLEALPQQQQTQALNTQIAEWSKDKPDFAAVRQTMAALAKQNPEASLDTLYEEARWAHPEIRERILTEREDKRLRDLQGKRQAGAQSPRGGQTNGAVHARKPTMSLEDEIAMHLDGGV